MIVDCFFLGGSEEEELIFLTQPPFVAHLFNFFLFCFTLLLLPPQFNILSPTPPFFCTSGRQLPPYCTGFHCFDELVLICNTYTPTLVPLSYYQHAVSVGSQCMDIIFFLGLSILNLLLFQFYSLKPPTPIVFVISSFLVQ